jgi:hypothetical protein
LIIETPLSLIITPSQTTKHRLLHMSRQLCRTSFRLHTATKRPPPFGSGLCCCCSSLRTRGSRERR